MTQPDVIHIDSPRSDKTLLNSTQLYESEADTSELDPSEINQSSVGHKRRKGLAKRTHVDNIKKKSFINLMTIRKWHWMSSAICFACMLLFSVTGITLNHAADIESAAKTFQISGQIPVELLPEISPGQKTIALPPNVLDWLKEKQNISLSDAAAEVNDGEIYLPQARPGGDAWLSIDIESGEFEYESTDRGWISYLNDLHKGRNTGKAWIYFMDVFSVACIIFSITGFLLLQRYADTRAQTWPLVIAGFILPFILMLFFVHK